MKGTSGGNQIHSHKNMSTSYNNYGQTIIQLTHKPQRSREATCIHASRINPRIKETAHVDLALLGMRILAKGVAKNGCQQDS